MAAIRHRDCTGIDHTVRQADLDTAGEGSRVDSVEALELKGLQMLVLMTRLSLLE